MHMTCELLKNYLYLLKIFEMTIDIGSCGYEFCWECTGPWVNNSCGNCFGGPVVQYE